MTNTSANIPSSVSQPTDLVRHKAIDQARPQHPCHQFLSPLFHLLPVQQVVLLLVVQQVALQVLAGLLVLLASKSDGFAAVASGGAASGGDGFASALASVLIFHFPHFLLMHSMPLLICMQICTGSGFAAVGTWEPSRYRWYFSFFLVMPEAANKESVVSILLQNYSRKRGLEIFAHK
ncbi:hypothetical protein OIU84_023321 [Salix udensis]|uniref:Uncharacterized protein n=1 Tax=Salix udensis TaxID=889485 RepID=A0AAD6KSV3_9ROSI|nr:hypothetical protein OIU84_023321 [Salix udensis]